MSVQPPLKLMDLLTLFHGIDHQPRLAIKDIRKGMSAAYIASTHIEPNLSAIEQNAGQECDPMYLAYLLEYVVNNSKKS